MASKIEESVLVASVAHGAYHSVLFTLACCGRQPGANVYGGNDLSHDNVVQNNEKRVAAARQFKLESISR